MPNEIKDGGPAFPLPSGWTPLGEREHYHELGMSLRDWFAGQAMHGWVVDDDDMKHFYNGEQPEWELMAKNAYAFADAMLKARQP